MVAIGELPGGDDYGTAADASYDGSVIVGSSETEAGREAFRWTLTGGMVGLGYLPQGDHSIAYAVSSDGSVISGASESALTRYDEACLWYEDGAVIPLGFVPNHDHYSQARGISGDGTVAAGLSHSLQAGPRAFRWSQEEGIEDLGEFPQLTTDAVHAFAVSADGTAIVGEAYVFGENPWPEDRAFRWTRSDGMVGLPLLGGGDYSKAYAASGDGGVVVGMSHSALGEQAFIWDSENGTRSVADVLTGEFGLDLEGWRLAAARAISDDGLVIAGWGYSPSGRREGWVATTPEPATLSLLALGGLAVLRRRRVRTKPTVKTGAPGKDTC
jgi:probable HAF family extracellular repeat protein